MRSAKLGFKAKNRELRRDWPIPPLHDLRHSTIERWKLLLPAYCAAALAGHVEVTGLTTDRYGGDPGDAVEELREQFDRVPSILGPARKTARRKRSAGSGR